MKVKKAALLAGRGLVERSACRRLAELAGGVPADQGIVELGAYCGRSTAWLVHGSAGAHVWSVDPWDTLADDAVSDRYAAIESGYRNGNYLAGGAQWIEHMAACRITAEHVTPMPMTAIAAAAEFGPIDVGLLFHDAVHSFDAVRADLTAWLPHLASRCTVALHDLGNREYGVEAAAEAVLKPAGFDWRRRERRLWKKAPDRRGLLVVHRNGGVKP